MSIISIFFQEIDKKKMRAQGYDGASVMSGKKTGVQARMKVLCSAKAIYVHCTLPYSSASKHHKAIEQVLRTLMII